ncbi:hypothetical protein CYLTODRAFT_374506 [Cylindrobasidium torrendii FP15055 ss-10]|uniref:Uncharacterized protein n=1 Tax=Cylindrobasidium torrendii FP15055 ss-10 TaxID=1314674 RepID=A0A0D7BDX2_9AGAR|nr:hypothetical protein CYLTODRAFT_374506 [Cylindrobasidium torrendii FP15055 ss-10]
MSLDQNLFTLVLTPNPDDASVVDLVDPAGTIYYRKQRTPNSPVYSVEVYDFMTESLLVKATAPSATSKTKILELYNPTSTVELKYTGTLTFRWSFKWEGHEFEWKREECYLIRKPDPPVLVAITKEPSGRLKTHTVQLLDYNINRFDIEDRKGLEITMLTALLTFQDANEAYHTPNSSDASILPTALRRNTTKDVSPTPTPPPPLPTKPPAKTGVDRVAELQALRGEYNEVVIEDECDVADYAQYSWNLLQDDAILFVSILASDAPQVPKVLQTVEETKRLRYRAANMDELHQYVVYDTLPAKGPRRINLDSKDKYEAPKSILVHLSKIPMPELQPKPSLSSPPGGSSAGASGSTLLSGSSLFWRRDKGKEKERPKEDKSL